MSSDTHVYGRPLPHDGGTSIDSIEKGFVLWAATLFLSGFQLIKVLLGCSFSRRPMD